MQYRQPSPHSRSCSEGTGSFHHCRLETQPCWKKPSSHVTTPLVGESGSLKEDQDSYHIPGHMGSKLHFFLISPPSSHSLEYWTQSQQTFSLSIISLLKETQGVWVLPDDLTSRSSISPQHFGVFVVRELCPLAPDAIIPQGRMRRENVLPLIGLATAPYPSEYRGAWWQLERCYKTHKKYLPHWGAEDTKLFRHTQL